MEIKKDDFISVLNAVKPGLSRKEIIEQQGHFIFTGSSLVTYNDLLCIHYPFETDFKCSVKAEDLEKILSKITNIDTIDISLSDDIFHIKAKGLHVKLHTLHEDSQMVLDDIKALQEQINGCENWFPVPKNFLEGVSLCKWAASKDETLGRLTCIKVDGEDMMSSDGIRASWFKLEGKMCEVPFLFKASTAGMLPVMEIEEAALSESWLHLATKENAMYSIRLVKGDFPDILKHFNDIEGPKIKLTKDIVNSVELSSVMSEGKLPEDKAVLVHIEKDKMEFFSKNDRGSVMKEIQVESTDESRLFSINPHLLLQILDKSTTMTIQETNVIFESGSFKHLLLMIIESESTEEDVPF